MVNKKEIETNIKDKELNCDEFTYSNFLNYALKFI